MDRMKLVLGLSACAVLMPADAALGQAKYPDWPFAKSYDSVTAAPQNNKLLFEDAKLRLVEVIIRPGETAKMSGQPYPAAYLYDAPLPDAKQVITAPLDAKSTLNGQGAGYGAAPPGAKYPSCATMAPLAPRTVTNKADFPIHYYRLEFKRLDGDGLPAHWKTWYPWMVGPIPEVANLDPSKLGAPFSKDWPYPIELDSVKAAPNNHKALYTDAHVRLVEVTERPESQENLHGHPYSSVFVSDTGFAAGPNPAPPPATPPPSAPLGQPGPYHKGESGDYQLDPKAQQRRGAVSAPPAGMTALGCLAAGPQAPHAHINGGETPSHFYRLEFLRIDGDDLKTKWKQWYPN